MPIFRPSSMTRSLKNPATLRRTSSILAGLGFLFAGCVSGSTAEAESPMPFDHHVINYLEFTVPDLEVAKRFYGEAFGWTFQDYGPEYAGMQKAGGEEFGGLALEPVSEDAGPRGGVLAVVYSDELDASLASVRGAGGRITKEPFDFPGGRRFQFLDPAGNELAVWTLTPAPEG